MNHTQLIHDLIHELSFRVGIPNLKNKEHQSIISEILTEWDMFDEKYIIMEFLTEAPTDADTEGDDKDYFHKGAGIYVKMTDKDSDTAQKYKKDGKQMKPISDDEASKIKGDQGEKGAAAASKTSQNQQGGDGGVSDEDVEKKKNVQKTFNTPSQKAQRKIEKEVGEKIRKEKEGNTSDSTADSNNTEKLSEADKSKVRNQILMTQEEASTSQEGVGLGTAESRTGESVTVYAGQKIKELLTQGKSYDEARDIIEEELLKIALDKKYVLTKEWAKSGLAVFDYLNDTIGVENIEHFAWDTPEGNTLVQSTGHGTSADMFVRTEDGRTIGVSLKKDFKVFIVNGGYGKAMKEFQEKVGIKLPENCQASTYTKRRNEEYQTGKETVKNNRKDFEEVAEKLLNDEEFFNKVFGPKSQSYEKRKRYIEKKLGISDYKDATPQQVVDLLINENQKSTGDDLKFFASFNKEASLKEKYGIYTNLRSLDNEMTENIFEFFTENGEAREKYKEKIIEDTHIIDTLFPEPPLDDFKTMFGTDPAVEMTRGAVGSIFGVSELMKQYENTDSDEERSSIKQQIENQIKEKLVITKKKGVPVIAINLEGPPQSELPLYKLGVRTRGIGNAQSLEVSQETFGSLALKNGNTDIENWDDKDRKTVVDQEAKDILNDVDDEDFDYDSLTIEEKQDLEDRLSQLEKWYPKSSTLKKLKKALN